MTSAARLAANRANARASTGPRTAAGKANSARNARRHGLNLPAHSDLALAREIIALAREIAGPDASLRRFQLACRIASAQIDLARVRRARHEILSADPTATARLAILDRYERRALSRRKFAIRAFDKARADRPQVDFGETNPTPGAASVHFGETNPTAGPAAVDFGETNPTRSSKVLRGFGAETIG